MYKLIGINSVKRLADGVCIPFADGNRDYEEYKLWLADGNIPDPEFTEEELAQQELNKQLEVAKNYLSKTDHKFYNGYKPKDGEDLVDIEAKRDEYREFIRTNEVQ